VAADNELWTEAPEVVRLFPTFVWRCQLRPEIHQPINAAILKQLDAMRRGQPPLDRGMAWQSGHQLHQLQELRGVVSSIQTAVDRVLDFVRIGDLKASLTGCWINVNAPAAEHKMHTHPNNFLSGVYYVQVQDGADSINFHDPRAQTAVIRPPVLELTAYNTDRVVLALRTGTLIIFPAWLPHSVDANRSELPRISVSFNAMFVASAETLGRPLWGQP
jgi:uncharacterized protein (TIGR02466 family)